MLQPFRTDILHGEIRQKVVRSPHLGVEKKDDQTKLELEGSFTAISDTTGSDLLCIMWCVAVKQFSDHSCVLTED